MLRAAMCMLLMVIVCACGTRDASSSEMPPLVLDPRCRINERAEDTSGWPPRGVLMSSIESGRLRLRDTRAMRDALESYIAAPHGLDRVAAPFRDALKCPPHLYSADDYGTHVAGYWVSPGEDAGHVRLFQAVEIPSAGTHNVVADLEQVGARWVVRSLAGAN
ncbi:MAG: hypothetical protein IPK60_09590 [Sandaracinaceae bacterium]|nr:hypothetical protein [Sandaracinaceae bacterium]